MSSCTVVFVFASTPDSRRLSVWLDKNVPARTDSFAPGNSVNGTSSLSSHKRLGFRASNSSRFRALKSRSLLFDDASRVVSNLFSCCSFRFSASILMALPVDRFSSARIVSQESSGAKVANLPAGWLLFPVSLLGPGPGVLAKDGDDTR